MFVYTVRINTQENFDQEKSIVDLTDSLYQTCRWLDVLGASANALDCCISDATVGIPHQDRDQFLCFGRPAGMTDLVIPSSSTCASCPAGVF